MKNILAALIIIGITQSLHSQISTTQKLDELMNVYTSFNKFNGSVLVARSGKILLNKGYGFKNVKTQSLNDSNTIFMTGSITKEFTAAIILKLADQKKIKLSDKLSRFYPEFPKGDSITISNLLTNTSGIFNYTELKDFWSQSSKPVTERQVLDTLMKKPLEFHPGEKFSYSNSNYMLLAYIIQNLTHKSYEKIVREMIFQPLGMSHSGFDFTGLKSADKAVGYWNFSAAKTTEGPVNDSSEFIGSGDLYSTILDLYKWHLALQSGQILKKSVQRQAYQVCKGQYGYGWELDTVYGKKIVGHGGRMFGFESRMTRIPEDDVFVILLNNTSDGPYLYAISKQIAAIIYDRPYTLPEQPLKLTGEMLKRYEGVYQADESHSFEIRTINGHLFGVESPDNMLELFPLKNNRLKFMEHEGEEGVFEFSLDENGTVIGFSTISPRGIKLTLNKIK